jgi:hypothetical protein
MGRQLSARARTKARIFSYERELQSALRAN